MLEILTRFCFSIQNSPCGAVHRHVTQLSHVLIVCATPTCSVVTPVRAHVCKLF